MEKSLKTNVLDGLRISRYESFADAREAWASIEEKAAGYPFQSYGWLELWQETLGMARGCEPRIVLIERPESGERVLLPLGVVRKTGLRGLVWLGAPVSDYLGPLFAGNFSGETLLAAVQEEARLSRCSFIDLENMPERLADSTPSPMVDSGARRLHYAAHGLELPSDPEAYLKEKLSSKERYNLRRAEKKLAEIGKLDFAVAETEADRLRFTEAMIGQKRARYRATGAADNFEDAAYERFYREGVRREGLGIHISALLLNDEPIAAHWGVCDEKAKTMYFLMPSFDAAYERYSPGVIFLTRFIQLCVDSGLRRLDFTVGDEIYKDKWCGDETGLYFFVRGRSLGGLLYAGGMDLVERAKSGPLLEVARTMKKALRR
jgi:CelD/BcsL family acetyltransferase involved in cellulose biosynthesis